jgi:hypothetical protein
MFHDGVIIFRELVGKLAILRIECEKCGCSGQYRVDRLIQTHLRRVLQPALLD